MVLSKKLVINAVLVVLFATLAFSFSIVFTPFRYTFSSLALCLILSLVFFFFNRAWDTKILSRAENLTTGIIVRHLFLSLLIYVTVTSAFFYFGYKWVVFYNTFFYATGIPLCLVFSLLTHSSLYVLRLQKLMKNFSTSNKIETSESYVLRSGNNSYQIPIKNIKYVQSSEKINRLFTWENKQYIIDHSISEMETICRNADLFRANRQFLISRKAVLSYRSIENNKILLSLVDGEAMQISRYKAPEFRLWIKNPPSVHKFATVQQETAQS